MREGALSSLFLLSHCGKGSKKPQSHSLCWSPFPHQSLQAATFQQPPGPGALNRGPLAPGISSRAQQSQASPGLCCPLVLAYICRVIDAIRDEKQARQAQGYLKEGKLEWAQHQQLKLLPEGRKGQDLGYTNYPPHKLPPAPSRGSWAEAWLP